MITARLDQDDGAEHRAVWMGTRYIYTVHIHIDLKLSRIKCTVAGV